MLRNYRHSMTSDTRKLKGLSDFLTRTLASRLKDRDLLDDIIISADEIATNIILHAYRGEKGRKISLEIQLGREKIVLTFLHEGRVFDPEKVPQPVLSKTLADRKTGGLGLFIINQLMDEVVYRFRTGETGFNSITVIKYLDKKRSLP